ncbi:MAG: DegT/DnrJ/EryC1/StrS family aminotransferase [Nitrospinales bacterium]
MILRCDLSKQYKKYSKEIDVSIKRALKSGRYTLGEEVRQFELEFARYLGTKYAVGVASGTDALILSMKALGLTPGDEVITTPFTAIPTVAAIIAAGARPVFVDIDLDTYLIDVNKIEKAISEKTKAIIPVHLFGNVVNVDQIDAVTNRRIPVIEDACQAHGSCIAGKKAGTLGVLGAFSFYPTKNLGGYGDGGIISTNSEELANKITLLRMYGMVEKDRIIINGVNSRLDELQAAVLRVKLRYLEEMNGDRKAIAHLYKEKLHEDYFVHQKIPDNVVSNYHVFSARFRGNRKQLLDHLDSRGIQANVYYPVPLHLQEAHSFLNYKKNDFPNTEQLCNDIIALPMYPEFKPRLQNKVIQTINRYLKNKGGL